MIRLTVLLIVIIDLVASGQTHFDFDVEAEKKSASYLKVKDTLISKYRNFKPGKFGEFTKGVDEDMITTKKTIGLDSRCLRR